YGSRAEPITPTGEAHVRVAARTPAALSARRSAGRPARAALCRCLDYSANNARWSGLLGFRTHSPVKIAGATRERAPVFAPYSIPSEKGERRVANELRPHRDGLLGHPRRQCIFGRGRQPGVPPYYGWPIRHGIRR